MLGIVQASPWCASSTWDGTPHHSGVTPVMSRSVSWDVPSSFSQNSMMFLLQDTTGTMTSSLAGLTSGVDVTGDFLVALADAGLGLGE
eukprot:5307542-Amphidinium_carterae.1